MMLETNFMNIKADTTYILLQFTIKDHTGEKPCDIYSV